MSAHAFFRFRPPNGDEGGEEGKGSPAIVRDAVQGGADIRIVETLCHDFPVVVKIQTITLLFHAKPVAGSLKCEPHYVVVTK